MELISNETPRSSTRRYALMPVSSRENTWYGLLVAVPSTLVGAFLQSTTKTSTRTCRMSYSSSAVSLEECLRQAPWWFLRNTFYYSDYTSGGGKVNRDSCRRKRRYILAETMPCCAFGSLRATLALRFVALPRRKRTAAHSLWTFLIPANPTASSYAWTASRS